jgi:hypothetical protein
MDQSFLQPPVDPHSPKASSAIISSPAHHELTIAAEASSAVSGSSEPHELILVPDVERGDERETRSKWRRSDKLRDVNWRRVGRLVGNVALSAGLGATTWYGADSPTFAPLAGPLANAAVSNALRQAREVRDTITEDSSPLVQSGKSRYSRHTVDCFVG